MVGGLCGLCSALAIEVCAFLDLQEVSSWRTTCFAAARMLSHPRCWGNHVGRPRDSLRGFGLRVQTHGAHIAVLDLSECSWATDALLDAVMAAARLSPCLRQLDLTRCSRLSLSAVDALVQSCAGTLELLRLYNFGWRDRNPPIDPDKWSAVPTPGSLAQCSRLHTLAIEPLPILRRDLCAWQASLPLLTDLQVSGGLVSWPEGDVSTSVLDFGRWPALRSLKLCHCALSVDEVRTVLGGGCRRLRHLTIGPWTASLVSSVRCPELETLALGESGFVALDALRLLVSRCRRLREVYFGKIVLAARNDWEPDSSSPSGVDQPSDVLQGFFEEFAPDVSVDGACLSHSSSGANYFQMEPDFLDKFYGLTAADFRRQAKADEKDYYTRYPWDTNTEWEPLLPVDTERVGETIQKRTCRRVARDRSPDKNKKRRKGPSDCVQAP